MFQVQAAPSKTICLPTLERRPCRARSTCSAAAAVDGARGEESDVVGVGTLPLQGNTWRTGHLKLSHMHSALARCAAMRRAAGGAFLLFPCSLSPLSSLLSPLSSLLSPLSSLAWRSRGAGSAQRWQVPGQLPGCLAQWSPASRQAVTNPAQAQALRHRVAAGLRWQTCSRACQPPRLPARPGCLPGRGRGCSPSPRACTVLSPHHLCNTKHMQPPTLTAAQRVVVKNAAGFAGVAAVPGVLHTVLLAPVFYCV